MLVVISGPSGVGKTTIVRSVVDRLPDATLSVSATTRTKTGQDQEGVDYFFLSEDEFMKWVDEGRLLEHANYAGNWYGTPKAPVDELLDDHRIVILEIDVQGGLLVKEREPDALSLFILPPTEETLLERLKGRGRDDEQVIQKRFSEAKREIQVATESGAYDHSIVNDDLEGAIDKACKLILDERARRSGTVNASGA